MMELAICLLLLGVLVLFVILFAHVAAGFCTALVGFYVINRGGDSSRITTTQRRPRTITRTRRENVAAVVSVTGSNATASGANTSR